MLKKLLTIKRINSVFYIAMLLALSACVTDDLSLEPAHTYTISGLDGDADAQDYLQNYLKDYTPKTLESEDAEELKRYEDYQERVLKSQLIKALNAKGYYDAQISYQDNETPNSGDYAIETGAAYTISTLKITPPVYEPFIQQLSIQTGQIIEADRVLIAQEKLFNKIKKDKCYYKSEIAHQVVLDKDNKTAEISFNITTQPESTFGDVVFEGQEQTKESYLRKLIPFKAGDCYRAEKIQSLREKIMATGLFSRVEIDQPENAPADHIIPITVNLRERASRTIRTGLSYYTDEGIGLVLGWVHRNFFGAVEKLEAKLKLSQLQQKLTFDLTKPFFLRKDQNLSLSAALERQDTDAFEELSIGSSASLSRTFNKRLTGNTGAALKLSRITDKSTNLDENYGLVSFPNSLSFDNRDDKLDPHKGWAIRAMIEPFIDAFGTSDPFIKARLSASTYYGFSKDVVLATRANIGSIMGADIDNIPATERFYSGGGGSVRGFGYQEVGPLTNGDPSGGASVIEGATELRFKITDKIGAVTFIDAGNVSEEITPQFSDFSVGAGVGLRYYTSFGPLRFDVATPLTNKENTAQNYQIYISIGQAF